MKKYLKPIIYILLFLVLSLIVLHQVYKVVSASDSSVISKSEAYRAEIETGPKKWLNGYLGIFFRFKSMGNINWLVLPLLLWFLLSRRGKNLKAGHKALLLVWLLGTVFICATGYSNSRYQLTLFPLTAFLVLILMWERLNDKPWLVKILGFSLLTGLCVYNIVYFAEQYRLFWELKVTRATAHFPQKMVDFLNEDKIIGTNLSRVYVFNQPFYYYHTQKKAIDYVSPIYTEIFVDLTRKEAGPQDLYTMIHKKNGVDYILVGGAILSQYRDRMLTEFLNTECKPVISESSYILYAIRNPSLQQILATKPYQNLPTVSALTAETHGIRGTFKIDKDAVKGRLMISNLTPSKKGERLLQFGFDSLNPNSGVWVPPGKYIHFVVEGQISKGIVNRNNYIFIRDFKEKWESTTTYFVSHLQRTYLLSRLIRPGSTRVIMGIRFTPQSPADKLLITNIRAYISDLPL
jgi:hypothetical protein